ncbi:microtubule-associated protein futsch-like isoform X3 [Phlebotomus papatasi]|nr:microtubule-associated protein futsch-like isoform X3 [Phlebotomus papatasi]XP_055708298.1 microtubule-associated protein futsch-like isoform X3 [Phlebotomus papatasi]
MDPIDPVPPVAPPRKKRPSMLSHEGRKVKNGFKDVFGSDTPRRFSCDSVDNAARPRELGVDVEVPLKQSQSYDFDSVGFADFSREQSPTNDLDRKILPRVGNKKSDKFFGENLSDCLSDEYVSDDQKSESTKKEPPEPPKDAIEKFVEQNIAPAEAEKPPEKEKVTKTNSLDKKAEFLMAMLDGYVDDEALYAGRIPVEEPIIVPKRKQTKHICDDDDHMHHHFHKHEKQDDRENQEKKSDTLKSLPGELGPKKPERDLARYRRSVENLEGASTTTEVEKPVRKKKSLSRENLPSPPPRPDKAPENVTIVEVGYQSTEPPPISPKPKPMKKIPSMPNNLVLSTVDKAKESKRSQLQKCQSSGALVPEDLMSEIKRRVYEFQVSQEYLPEDHSHQTDGSDLVRPQSKLEKRKVSVSKKTSNASSVDLDPIPDDEATRTKFSIGNTEVKITEEVKEMSKEPRGSPEFYKSVSDMLPEKPIETIVEKPDLEKPKEFKEASPFSETHVSSPTKKDVTHPPAEESVFSQISRQKAEDNIEKILQDPDFDVKAISNVLEDIYANNKTILEDFQAFLENEADSLEDFGIGKLNSEPAKEEKVQAKPQNVPEINVERERKESASSDGSISDDNYSNLIKDTPKENVTNKTLLALANERGRRESIDDVNNWFENHIDQPLVSPKIQNLLQEARKGRRGSDFSVGYDTTTLYPFGSHPTKRHGSESEEFFEKIHLSKSAENVGRDKVEASEEDHSNLLKFLKSEAAHSERANSVPNDRP